jgi:hypothetical protein
LRQKLALSARLLQGTAHWETDTLEAAVERILGALAAPMALDVLEA